MTHDEAARALDDVEVVPCMQARLDEAKELLAACLDADIPALLGRAACCGQSGCGCAPKLELLVRPDNLSAVATLLNERWQGMLDREGTFEVDRTPDPAREAEPPCPACGTAAPLVAGACSGCGLQLE